MKKTIKTILVLFVLSVAVCFISISMTYSQDILPQPGEVINKDNIDKYAHLFPPEYIDAFKTGFDGLIQPIEITVAESRPTPVLTAFKELAEKNRGKYDVDEDGMITGGYDYIGQPFPDLDESDPKFATKLMWNYYYRYQQDDAHSEVTTFFKRRGESLNYGLGETWNMQFTNRLFCDPHPFYETPNGADNATMYRMIKPEASRNVMALSYISLDQTKVDESYAYVPSLRRALRGEANQRSTPIGGTMAGVATMDDRAGFSGKVSSFTYEYIGTQKILGSYDSTMTADKLSKMKLKDVPFHNDGWEVRDVYVIDIYAKDSRYPQSKKRVYLDKGNLNVIHAVMWDRAGELWKYTDNGMKRLTLENGEVLEVPGPSLQFELQFGIALFTTIDIELNQGIKYEFFTPTTMLQLGR